MTGRDPRADAVLLRAYEIDRVVHEVLSAARHRPERLPVPLTGRNQHQGGDTR